MGFIYILGSFSRDPGRSGWPAAATQRWGIHLVQREHLVLSKHSRSSLHSNDSVMVHTLKSKVLRRVTTFTFTMQQPSVLRNVATLLLNAQAGRCVWDFVGQLGMLKARVPQRALSYDLAWQPLQYEKTITVGSIPGVCKTAAGLLFRATLRDMLQ